MLEYKPINDTPFELHVFWSPDTERRIKLTFSEFVSLSLKTRLMTVKVWPILSGFFSKLFTCLLYADGGRQRGSVEVIYTLRDGLNFPTVMRLVGSSALGLPMDYLGPIACDSLATRLNTACTGAWDNLQ